MPSQGGSATLISAPHLGDLVDVVLSGPSDKQALRRHAAGTNWTNQADPPDPPGSTFAGLGDVDVAAKAEGTPIVYAAGTSKYIAVPFSGASVAIPFGAHPAGLCPHGVTTTLNWSAADWDAASYQDVLSGRAAVGVAGYYFITAYLAVFETIGLNLAATIDTPIDDLQPINNAGATVKGDFPDGASMAVSQLFKHPSDGTFGITIFNAGAADIHIWGTAQIVRLATF